MIFNSFSPAEPEVLMDLSHNKTFDSFPSEKKNELLKSSITLLYHSAIQTKPTETIDCLILKSKAHAIGIAASVTECFPKTKHLYMYRHPIEYVKSVRSVVRSLLHPLIQQMPLALNFGSDFRSFCNKQFITIEDVNWTKVQAMFDAIEGLDYLDARNFAGLFCSNIAVVKQMSCLKNINFLAVSYHDLQDSTDQEMRRIRSFCDIDQSRQCSLPKRDTQHNSDLSRAHLKKFKNDLTEEEIKNVDFVLSLCDLPPSKEFPIHGQDFEKSILARPTLVL